MPKIVDHRERKQEIVDVALELFAERGINDVNLVTIAKQCRLSRPTLYLYFRDKDEIFSYALKTSTDTLLKKYLDYASEDRNRIDILIDICTSIVQTAYKKRKFLTNLADLMFQLRKQGKDFSRDIRKRTIRLSHLFYDIFRSGIERGEIAENPTKETIAQIFAMMEAFAFQMATVSEYNPASSIQILTLYLDSLRSKS